MPRRLDVEVRPMDDQRSPVLLPALVRSLDALQKVVLQLGDMLAEPTADRSRGRFRADVQASCEFEVRAMRFASAHVALELRPPPQPCLFLEPLGERALQAFLELTKEVTSGATWDAVSRILPAESQRRRILGTYKRLCPTASDGVEVIVGSDGVQYHLLPATRTQVQVLAAQTSSTDVLKERQIIGRLIMLRSRPAGFEIRQERRTFGCPYDPDIEEQLLGMYDAIVAVKGVCRIVEHEDEDDEILELCDIGEVDVVDEAPLDLAALVEGTPVLSADLEMIEPDFSDNLVTFECPELSIIAHGETRADAEAAFRDELLWLWNTYALADGADLAADASALKASLLRLAERKAS